MLDDELMFWEEGLLIRPQHLQAAQRQSMARAAAVRRLALPFSYGLISMEIDRPALSAAAGRVLRFTQLHLLLKDGTEIHQGVNADVRPLNLSTIHAAGERVEIHLAVAKVKDRFRNQSHARVADEAATAEPTEIIARRWDARLMPGDPPDPRDFESLPIARLIMGTACEIDETYAPPWVLLGGGLLRIVREILNRFLEARIEASADLLRMQALSVYAAELSHALLNPSLTAFDAFGICVRGLAATAAISGQPDLVQSAYDHDHPLPSFEALRDRIFDATTPARRQPRGYELKPLGPPFPADLVGCTLVGDLLTQGYSCVLAVGSDVTEEVESLIGLKNLRVGAPQTLVAMRPEYFLPWQLMPGPVSLPALHQTVGVTKYLLLPVQPQSPAWQQAITRGMIGARVANGRKDSTLKLKMYLVPPSE